MTKFYNIILLLGAIQLFLIKTSEATPSNKTLIAKSELIDFYENEINVMSKDYCADLEKISEGILNEKVIKSIKAPIVLELKRNMKQYQEMYALYTRLGLYKPLVSYFAKSTVKFYHQEDLNSKYIVSVFKKLNYDKVLDNFERSFMDFVIKGFLPAFEIFEKRIPRNETKDWQKLLNWAQALKACKSYDCYYKSFLHFDKIILTPKEQLFAYISLQLRNLGVFYGNGTYHIAKDVLKHDKIKQLSPDVQQALKINLQHFIQMYDDNSDLNNFNKIFDFLHRLVLSEFLNNENMPEEDARLLREIFDGEGYAQFEVNYLKKFKQFVDIDLYKKIEEFKANLSREELAKEKKLIDALTRIKGLKSFEVKKLAITEIMNEYYGVPQEQ